LSRVIHPTRDNIYMIWIEYIEITVIDWSDEYKLCCIG
jgi:hypothetical protein